MKILLTGGTGLLGKELLKLDKEIIAPSHFEMDIRSDVDVNFWIQKIKPDVIIHAAAFTTPLLHQGNFEKSIETNIIGTANIAKYCKNIRLVYLSTDYLYTGGGEHKEDEPVKPTYAFAWSKLGGECSVALVPNSLILRLSFGARPFPHEKVYDNQMNSKLYVDEIAPKVLKAAKSQITGIMNVGGERHTLYEYAKQTRPDIKTIPTPEFVPRDTSLNTEKYDSIQ